MKLDLICFNCIKEQIDKGAPVKEVSIPIPINFQIVNNKGIYDVLCDKGHNSKCVINNIDFEILFDYALNAIIDGYYREATITATAALERFYEFFIKTILIENGANFDKIKSSWDIISKQSERQLGAFIMLYTSAFQKEPQLLKNSSVSFRNNVAHKGYIPEKEETINFTQEVLNIIEGTLLEQKRVFKKSSQTVFEKYGYCSVAKKLFQDEKDKTGKEVDYAVVNIMTTINFENGREVNESDRRRGSINQIIESMIDYRNPRKVTLIKEIPN